MNRRVYEQRFAEVKSEQKMLEFLGRQGGQEITSQLATLEREKIPELYRLAKKQSHMREFKRYLE